MTDSFSNDSDASGRRVRLRPKPGAVSQIYGGDGILTPLRQTNGLVFPYQPSISYGQDVSYQTVDMVHTNQELYAYSRTNAVKLTIDGQFTCQNQTEGLYALAAIHFLRTVVKMYFGASANPGTPPPVLLMDAFGQYMFNQLPVIVTSFSIPFPNDVDYLPVDLSNVPQSPTVDGLAGTNLLSRTPVLTSAVTNLNLSSVATQLLQSGLNSSDKYVWIPTLFNVTVSLTVQNTPSRLRTFDLDQFRTGALLTGGGWI